MMSLVPGTDVHKRHSNLEGMGIEHRFCCFGRLLVPESDGIFHTPHHRQSGAPLAGISRKRAGAATGPEGRGLRAGA
jgi:hypothetical protein